MHEDAVHALRFDPPDVVLVKRVEAERGNAKKERRRLQRLRARRAAREARDREAAASSVVSDEGDLEEEFAAFQAELEEDGELRALLAQHAAKGPAGAAAEELGEGGFDGGGEEEEEDGDEGEGENV